MVEKYSLFWNTFYQSAVGQVLLDLHGETVALNRAFCEFTGYQEEELLHDIGKVVCLEEDLENEYYYFSQLAKGEIETFQAQKRYVHKSGRIIWGLITVSLIENLENGDKYFFVQVQDITEEKLTIEYLHKSEKLSVAAQLAAAVAHEIRNPLTAIKGFTQLLKNSHSYNGDYLNIMLKELNKIEYIIDEYLELGNPPVNTTFQEKNIAELINQVVTLLKTQANMANQMIVFVKPYGPLPKVECNATAIKQVLINIINNALESMENGQTVLIKVEKPTKTSIPIKIIDTGCGISEERLKHLGEPFYSTKERGTGLGLMASFSIIEKHHGTIHIESTVGIGTTVIINLPIKQPVLMMSVANN